MPGPAAPCRLPHVVAQRREVGLHRWRGAGWVVVRKQADAVGVLVGRVAQVRRWQQPGSSALHIELRIAGECCRARAPAQSLLVRVATNVWSVVMVEAWQKRWQQLQPEQQ